MIAVLASVLKCKLNPTTAPELFHIDRMIDSIHINLKRHSKLLQAVLSGRDGSPADSEKCLGWSIYARSEAGVEFFGIERRRGFGCGKNYCRAVLVADPRDPAR
jgi:hypothetical protein